MVIILILRKKENIFNFQIQKINQDNKLLYVIKKIKENQNLQLYQKYRVTYQMLRINFLMKMNKKRKNSF